MILHGNCLDLLDYLPEKSIDLVFCDLPYAITQNKWDQPVPLPDLWNKLLRIGKDRAAFVFTATLPFAVKLIDSQPKLYKYDLVWCKRRSTGFFQAKHAPLRSHELILVFYRKLPTYNAQKTYGHKAYAERTNKSKSGNYGQHKGVLKGNDGSRWPLSFLSFDQPEERNFHPTQKPVALMEWLIKTYSNENDTVLDPTMGSASTGVACKNLNRQFIGMELDDEYIQTARQRLA